MNIIEELCKNEPEHIQQKIKAAYWQGCAEGITMLNPRERKIERREDNVVYLKKND